MVGLGSSKPPLGLILIMPVCKGVGRALNLNKKGWSTSLDFRNSWYVTSPSLSFLIYEMDMLMPAHPAYLTYMQSTSWEMLGWKKQKLESRLLGEISITWDMQMTPHPYGRKRRGTKKPLDENERGGWKSWLKAEHSENEDNDIWSHHFMANGWGNSGNCQTLFYWAPKSLWMVTAVMKLKDACSLEEKLWLP